MATENVLQKAPFVKENNLVHMDFLNDETPVVSSLDVARHFQKKHKHVLEEIRKIIANTQKSFHGPNFRPMSTDVKIGNGAVRQSPAYQMTRDGFCLLVMGFTGQVALQWRIRYIEAFNILEKAVRENIRTAGIEEGQRLQRRQDGLAVAERALAYRRKGLTLKEISILTACPPSTIRGRIARMRRALGMAARPTQATLPGVGHAHA